MAAFAPVERPLFCGAGAGADVGVEVVDEEEEEEVDEAVEDELLLEVGVQRPRTVQSLDS